MKLVAASAAGLGVAAGGVLAARAVRRSGEVVKPEGLEHIAPDTAGHRGGAGTPILLLHGMSVTWRTWKPILPLLEPHHEVIAPTLLGHSGAAPIADGIAPSIEALVDGVIAELDRLSLDRVHVVGNSLGGWIAMELARRGRARSVVAFSPGGAWRGQLRMTALVVGMRLGFELLESFGERFERLALTPRSKAALLAAQVEHPELFPTADLIADIRALRNASALRPLIEVRTGPPMAPLPDPGCPVRVVWARRDRMIPFGQYGRPILELVPSSELVMLDGVGHVPMSDDPEAVARLILQVTDAVDRGGPFADLFGPDPSTGGVRR